MKNWEASRKGLKIIALEYNVRFSFFHTTNYMRYFLLKTIYGETPKSYFKYLIGGCSV